MTKKPAIDPKTPAPVSVGHAVPPIDLLDQSGKRQRLKDYRGRWVVLYFYPKDDTPGCTKEACQFRDRQADFEKRDAAVLGISPDDAASHTKFIDKHSLPFDLLADTDKTVSSAYGVWQEKSMYGRRYMGVVRSTFLIDPKGKLAHRWDKVKVPGHEQAVIEKLDELRK